MSWDIYEYNMGTYNAWYINVKSFDGELEKIIDKHIVDICFADSFFTIQEAKDELKIFLKNEKQERREGAIAEFLIYVFMKYKGYQQECLCINLEENSPKKGFDGVYLDNNNVLWYMESKSGSNISTTHKAKVEEAYRCLHDKFSNTKSNSPWKNALNHAKVVGVSNNILDEFRKYTREYKMHISHNIEEFNIMPCGTVFRDDKTQKYKPFTVIKDIDKYFSKKTQPGLAVICVTQQTVNEFIKYLNK